MTYLIDFLGCKVNSYEADCVGNDLENVGYKFVKNDENPDVIVINTCSVTNTSGQKSRKLVRQYRDKYKNAIIVVMGCESQNEGSNFNDTLGADIVIGTSHRNEIVKLIDDFKKYQKPIYICDEASKITKYEDLKVEHFAFNTRAYVKIQDGCNNFCTYCLIPYLRGRSRSRKKESVLNEISDLVKNNYKEIVLTGIDTCSYGLDLNPRITFSDLLEEILSNNKDLYRLRISSIEESQIDDKFINLLEKYPNIANHLHIPLQSGSVEILKKMNRKYDLHQYVEKINKIRNVRPDISITTDVIVGFPSETEEQFLETFNFCKLIGFSKIHVFPYSIRKGTFASKMDNQLPMKIKKERCNRLIKLSNDLTEKYNKKFENMELEFLFENYDKKTKAYRGHSSNFLEKYYKSEENLTGKIKTIKY